MAKKKSRSNYRPRLDWDEIVSKVQKGKPKKKVIEMGSPGSAQVTRVRLLDTFEGIDVHTKGAVLTITKAA